MQKALIKLFILAAMLVGLPLAGVLSTSRDITPYLEFPPQTRYVQHAPFSLYVFLTIGIIVILAIWPLAVQAWKYRFKTAEQTVAHFHFPWWGYVGLVLGLTAWILAWTRFEWFAAGQQHTFTPLWLAYILVVNGLTCRRSGHCMMTRQPGFFLLLFPVSTIFWWFFEYLNRFVQNWYYIEVTRFSPLQYFLLASVSFSTVLPAVLGTREYLLTFSFFDRAFGTWIKLQPSKPKLLALFFLILAGASLAGIAVFPNLLYPLLWISPLVIIICLQTLFGEHHLFAPLAHGDWRIFATSSLAALLCGFFWELWNYYSLAKWIYSVPYVQRLHLFEMPLLGFAGYLPFGLECAVLGNYVARLITQVKR